MSRWIDLRRHAGGVAVEQLFSQASRAARLHPSMRALLREVTCLSDIAYTDSGQREHLLDIYRPLDREGPLPTVFFVHGGGFRILSKDTHWVMGALLARQGYQVFSINYRLAPAHPYPAAVQDACAALTWVAQHGASFGADLSRLALAGESAGANLITGLALSLSQPRPEPWARQVWDTGLRPSAAVAACGFLQVSDTARLGRRKPLPTWLVDRLITIEKNYLAGQADPQALELADPLRVLERPQGWERPLPPFFIPIGTRDPVLDDSRRLAAALQAQGVQAELRYYQGEVHAFHAFLWRERARQCWRDKFAFLARHLGEDQSSI